MLSDGTIHTEAFTCRPDTELSILSSGPSITHPDKLEVQHTLVTSPVGYVQLYKAHTSRVTTQHMPLTGPVAIAVHSQLENGPLSDSLPQMASYATGDILKQELHSMCHAEPDATQLHQSAKYQSCYIFAVAQSVDKELKLV